MALSVQGRPVIHVDHVLAAGQIYSASQMSFRTIVLEPTIETRIFYRQLIDRLCGYVFSRRAIKEAMGIIWLT